MTMNAPPALLSRVLLLLALALGGPGPTRAQQLFERPTDVIPPEVERLYSKGLQFLVQTQNDKGGWSDGYGAQPAVVGLAVLAMLAHGDDPNSGPYSLPVRRGIDLILGQQNKQTGYIGNTMYNHGFATLALAEAYGALNDERLGPALLEAVKLILSSQAQNGFGAWRYSPESKDADTTVSGAQLVALLAARNAGFGVPEDAIKKALQFYQQCQSGDGGFGYTGPGGSNGPRTAIGVLVFALAKQKDSPSYKSAFQFLNQAGLNESHYYHYYIYYASQAFFHASAEGWEAWNRINLNVLKNSQKPDGSWDGSFGSVFATSTSLLSVALNYRYLPIYER